MKKQLAAAALAVAGIFGFAHAAGAASSRSVRIDDFKFQPKRIVVKAGTRVTWVNRDGDPHTVKSAKGHFSSPALDTGKRYSVVLRHKGTFSYVCTIHPYMHGTVVVR
jgi:plastocyanin